jgi:hypothetical protein
MTEYYVYLIHFDRPVGRFQHYTGLARYDRLLRRMQQHGHGSGASLTRRAVAAGVGMTLVRTTVVQDPKQEQAIKRRGHAKARCPLCSPGLEARCTEARAYRLPTLPATAFKPVQW